jgi:hypothetical protein
VSVAGGRAAAGPVLDRQGFVWGADSAAEIERHGDEQASVAGKGLQDPRVGWPGGVTPGLPQNGA